MTDEMKILIVEDESVIAMELEERLRRLGYNVVGVAASARAALKQVEAQRPDIILMDIHIQGPQDGIEAAREIRARFNTPVIYLTAYADEITLRRAKSTEPSGYLLKPFRELEVRAVIEMALHKREMERQLQESQARNKALLNANPDLMFLFARDGLFLDYHVSSSPLALFLAPEQFMGRKISDVFSREFSEIFLNAIHAVLAGEMEQVIEYQLPVGGGRRFFEIRVVICTEQTALSLIRDITDRKQAEEKLRISEARYRAIVEDQTELVCRLSPEGQMTYVNESYLRFFKRTADEVIGSSVDDWGVKGQSAMIKTSLAMLGPSCPIISFEEYLILPDDGKRWLQWVDRAIIENGKVIEIQAVGRDITERKRAEQALFESEKRLSEAQSIAKMGSWELDLVTNQVQWSGELVNIFGIAVHEPNRADTLLRRVHPEDRRRVARISRETIAAKSSYEVEYRIVTPDGMKKHIFTRGRIICDKDGRPVKLFGAAQDITERKQVEEALRSSEEKYRVLVENATDSIYMVDRNYKVLSVNQVGAALFGRQPNELVGVSVFELFPKHLAEIYSSDLDEVFKTGAPKNTETKLIVGKHESWISVVLSPTTDERGNVTAVIGVSRDVTERKRADDELNRAYQLIESIFEHTHMMFAYMDPDFNFVRVNRAYADDDGLTPEYYVGKNQFELYPNAENEVIFRRVAATGEAEGVTAKPLEYDINGRRQLDYYDWVLTPVKDAENKVIGLILTLQNVTERIKAGEALQKSEQRYRDLFNSASIGIFQSVEDGTLLTANPYLALITGYESAESLMRVNTADLYVDPQERLNLMKRYGASGIISNEEICWKRMDGSPIWVNLNARVVNNEAEISQFFEGFVQDITERKRAENLLMGLNGASLAMQKASTLDEVFAGVSGALRRIGLNCTILLVKDGGDTLAARYFDFDTRIIQRAQKVAGLKADSFSMSIDEVDAYRLPVREKQTVLFEDMGDVLQQLLPGPLKKMSRMLVNILDIPKTINAPLIVDNEVFGIFSIQSNDLHPGDIPSVTAFANQVAAAWRQTQLFEKAQQEIAARKQAEEDIRRLNTELERRVEERTLQLSSLNFALEANAEKLRRRNDDLTALHRLALDMLSERKEDEILDMILQQAMKLMNAHYAGLSLPIDGETIMNRASVSNRWALPPDLPTRFERGRSARLVWQAYDTGQPAVIDDYYAWAGRAHEYASLRPYASASIPMLAGGRCVGVLTVSRAEPSPYTPEDIQIGTLLAQLAAVALNDIQLFNNAQKELDERKQAEQRLQAVNKELEAFAYSVSHDLRAPLRAINGYTRILIEDYDAVLDEDGKRVTLVIHDEARRMGELIDDLLAFSRLSHSEILHSRIDMNQLVQVVFEELAMPEDRARIELRMGQLPEAVGDASLLRQVWLNLLSNAIKFSSARERAIIEIGAAMDGREVIYSVSDNGAGFDVQYKDKLFGVFQRLHSDREFPGTGVGLAIVQRIIQRHGGRVWADGEIDRGAIFHFTLPHKGDQT